jgi:hypothetical protein
MLKLTPTDVKDPVYSSPNEGSIFMQVKFAEFPDYLPFNATPDDPMDYGRELYYNAQAGMYGPVGPYVPPPPLEPQPNQPAVTGAQTL